MSQFKSSSLEHVLCPQAQLTTGTSEATGHVQGCWGMRAGEQSPHQCLNHHNGHPLPQLPACLYGMDPTHYCVTPGFM